MPFVSRVLTLLLMGGMVLPAWAMRDCCCSRKVTAAPVRSCCAKRLAATTPVKKCCAARLKATSNTTAVQPDHVLLCRCSATAPTTTDPNSTRRLISPLQSPAWDMTLTAHPQTIAVPTLSTTVSPPPPLRPVTSQVWLCRWLV